MIATNPKEIRMRDALIALKSHAGLSQKAIAEACGVSQPAISYQMADYRPRISESLAKGVKKLLKKHSKKIPAHL